LRIVAVGLGRRLHRLLLACHVNWGSSLEEARGKMRSKRADLDDGWASTTRTDTSDMPLYQCFSEDGYKLISKNTFLSLEKPESQRRPRSRSMEPRVGSSDLMKGPVAGKGRCNESGQDGARSGDEPRKVDEEGATTLMLHGVSSRQGRHELMKIFEDLGFANAIDFVYVPQHSVTKRMRVHNLGYAFLNFVSPELRSEFQLAIHHHPLGRKDAATCARVYATLAEVQGLRNNVAKLRNMRFKGRAMDELVWIAGGLSVGFGVAAPWRGVA
jgi:hypothetical protein